MTQNQQAGVLQYGPHPDEPRVTLVRCGADISALMRTLGGTWNAALSAYMVPATLLDAVLSQAGRRGLITLKADAAKPGTGRIHTRGHDCNTARCQPDPAAAKRGREATRQAEAAAAEAHTLGLTRGEMRGHIDQAVDEFYAGQGVTLTAAAQLTAEHHGWTYHDDQPLPANPQEDTA